MDVTANGYNDSTGRTRQKARTREALIQALQTLLQSGADPSVAQVAEAAGISRTTAYRYFPDQQALLHAALPETGMATLLPEDAPDDPAARLAQVLDTHLAFLLRWEPQLRAALRASLVPGTTQPALRGGRAVTWFESALAPLAAQRPEIDLHQVAIRLRSVAGIEPYVWLTGVGDLSPDRASEFMRANALAVLADALHTD
ncbi:MAG: TetR/AcrR family transcriptional regulator [Actinobacteria bacterium]|nr:TetR/AcrR family transcriptional regulator [Actinomycetota bacterium]